MRAVLGSFACLTALASLACAAPVSAAPQGVYHLHGYYKLRQQVATWETSSDAPWQVTKNAPWVDPRLVKWGYVPVTHDSGQYYCLIEDKPMTGSNILEKTFICGDPKTVELIFNNNWRPKVTLYGGH